jgi:hypothetical protein
MKMSWTFENTKYLLEKTSFTLDIVEKNHNKKVLKSDFISLSEDVNKVNCAALYVYGVDNTNYDLIQLSASMQNKSYLDETELNFSALIKKILVLFTSADVELSDVFSYESETFTVGSYKLQIDVNKNECNAFIALTSNFEDSMKVRDNILYAEA